jgi:hypothetical protein
MMMLPQFETRQHLEVLADLFMERGFGAHIYEVASGSKINFDLDVWKIDDPTAQTVARIVVGPDRLIRIIGHPPITNYVLALLEEKGLRKWVTSVDKLEERLSARMVRVAAADSDVDIDSYVTAAAVLSYPQRGSLYVGFRGLTQARRGRLASFPVAGDTVVWKDEDGSLARHAFIIDGRDKTIDGQDAYALNESHGPYAAVEMVFTDGSWELL